MMDRHYQIDKWIPDGSKILDLGCGDGSFLKDLSEKKEITGFGVENDFEKINLCIKNGVSVLHHGKLYPMRKKSKKSSQRYT